MKISEFTKVLRKVIREEVRAAIKAELNEVVNPKQQDHREIINHGLKLHKKVDKFDKKNYAKNPLLNDILNETANAPIKTINGGPLTSQDAVGGIRNKFTEAMNPDKDFGGQPTAQEMVPEDKKHIPIPDYIQNALTKDYSSLVKAMDKKK